MASTDNCVTTRDADDFFNKGPVVCSSLHSPDVRKKILDNFLRERFLLDAAYRAPDCTFAVLASGQKVDGIVLYAVVDGVVRTFDYLDTTQCNALPQTKRVPTFIWPNAKGNVLRISRPVIDQNKAYIIMQNIGMADIESSYDEFTLIESPEW